MLCRRVEGEKHPEHKPNGPQDAIGVENGLPAQPVGQKSCKDQAYNTANLAAWNERVQ